MRYGFFGACETLYFNGNAAPATLCAKKIPDDSGFFGEIDESCEGSRHLLGVVVRQEVDLLYGTATLGTRARKTRKTDLSG